MYDYESPQKKQSSYSTPRYFHKQSQNQCPLANLTPRYAAPVIQRQLFSMNDGLQEVTRADLARYLAATQTSIQQTNPRVIQINSSNGQTQTFEVVGDAMCFLFQMTRLAIDKSDVFHINQYGNQWLYKIDFTKIISEDAAGQQFTSPVSTQWHMSSTGPFPKYDSKKRPPFHTGITDEITQYPTAYQNYPTSAGLKRSGLDQTHILSFGSTYGIINSFVGNFSPMPEGGRPHAVHTMKRLTATLGGGNVSEFVNEKMDDMFSDPSGLQERIAQVVPNTPKRPEEALYPFTAMIANNPANVGFGSASENRGIRERFDPQQYAGTSTWSYQTQVIAENLRQLEGVPGDLITSSLEQRSNKSGELRHSTDVTVPAVTYGTYEIDDLSDEQICEILEYGASKSSNSIQEIIRTGSSKEAAVPIIRATYIQVIVGPPGEGDCVSFTVRPISGPKQLYFSF